MWYTDFVSGLGAVTLGHPDPDRDTDWPANHWAAAIAEQAYHGAGFSLAHVSEQETAERIVDFLGTNVPGWQPEGLGVRFGLSGSDACNMLVRLCRAVTGRRRVVSAGYHGFGDWAVSVTPPAHGVTQPQYVDGWDGNDLNALDDLLTDGEPVAAVILEPPLEERSASWWRAVRQLCSLSGVMLALDEVVSGLRYGCGGAAGLFGVTPDAIAVGKGWGNGVPVSFMVYPRDWGAWFARSDPCFISSTHFGCPLGFAALNAVLDHWGQGSVDHIWRLGHILIDGLVAAGIEVVGRPPHFITKFASKAERGFFTAGMRDRSILWNRPAFVTLAHTEDDVAKTLAAALEVKAEMGQVDVAELMRGREPAILFEGR